MDKTTYQEIYTKCLAKKPEALKIEASEIVMKLADQIKEWWTVASEEELLTIGFKNLQSNFGSLSDKEVVSINEAMELTGYPTRSLVRLAINDTHFVGEILEFITTNPFAVYQQKRLADLMDKNNQLLEESLNFLKFRYTGDVFPEIREIIKVPSQKEIIEKELEKLSPPVTIQEKLNAIKEKSKIQFKD